MCVSLVTICFPDLALKSICLFPSDSNKHKSTDSSTMSAMGSHRDHTGLPTVRDHDGSESVAPERRDPEPLGDVQAARQVDSEPQSRSSSAPPDMVQVAAGEPMRIGSTILSASRTRRTRVPSRGATARTQREPMAQVHEQESAISSEHIDTPSQSPLPRRNVSPLFGDAAPGLPGAGLHVGQPWPGVFDFQARQAVYPVPPAVVFGPDGFVDQNWFPQTAPAADMGQGVSEFIIGSPGGGASTGVTAAPSPQLAGTFSPGAARTSLETMVFELNRRIGILEQAWGDHNRRHDEHQQQLDNETMNRVSEISVIECRLEAEANRLDSAVGRWDDDGGKKRETIGPVKEKFPMISRRGFETVEKLTGEIEGFGDWVFKLKAFLRIEPAFEDYICHIENLPLEPTVSTPMSFTKVGVDLVHWLRL